MKNKTILIANTPSHYRKEIYKKLSELGVDFYFSDLDTSIKSMDVKELRSKAEIGNYLGKEGQVHFLQGAVRKSLQYDSIIAVGNFKSIHVWLILFISIFSRKKIYLWTHAWYGRETFFKKLLKRIYFKLSEQVLTYNEKAKELMVNEGFEESIITPIYNSLASDFQKEVRHHLLASNEIKLGYEFNRSRPYFLFIGRITDNKKLSLVLDAMKLIEDKSFDFRVVGPEVDNGFLRKKALELGLADRVKIEGAIYDEAVLGKFIGNGIACIAPGNVGLTAIHSMTFGTPVITHSCYELQMPEVEAVINGQTGCLFDYGSTRSLAECMIKILRYNQREYEAISRNCMNLIDSKWNTENQIKIFKRILGVTS
ncbi:glycosyltransferase family 4 protein [Idiomarina sp. UBA4520]|uniref:glycosyltransferase family 4 protein n=1 Tax=Idiomarina sp. UBA4520 TaxID=1946647 RepID=UPI000C629067|nr:glycosyltransferase [Idiomarina sp. UBA4520]MBF39154.1 hypothetical protein [Idiomarinaceae bacterium]|tara:strand:- start:185 stop:1291 length:1107 start_codon:yes stop_codon:yes gene_type:complete